MSKKRKYNRGWSHVAPKHDKYAKARAKIGLPAIVPARTKFYFAYGSNLNKKQMRVRCPNARPLFKCLISDAAMVFRYYADFEAREGSILPGGLWKITPACERALDSYEGPGYKKVKLVLPIKYTDGTTREEEVLTYQMRDELGIMPPELRYYNVIEQGYEDFGLNTDWLEESLYHANAAKEKTEMTLRRWRKKGKPKLVTMATTPMVLQ